MPNNTNWLNSIGMAAAGATGSGLAGLGIGMLNDWRQINQQGRLNDQQMKYQKELTDYNNAKQLEMWKATGPVGQIEQYKKAGLNPGLIYGESGGGGQTANVNAGQLTAPEAPKGGNEAANMMMGMQLELLKAQKDNIEADTKNKEAGAGNLNADTINKPKIGANVEADTVKKIQETENLKTLQKNIVQDTNLKIANITQQTLQNHITEASAADQIATIRAEAVGKVLENSLTIAKTHLTNAQTAVEKKKIEEIVQHIVSMQAEISNNTNWKNSESQERISKAIDKLTEYETDPMNKWLENPGSAIQQIMQMGTPSGVKPITGFKR